jgi:N-acylneuraminate cytidylyltransferase
MLDVLARDGRTFDVFSLLRPTSPFRRGSTIVRAWEQLLALGKVADSIRAIEPCRQHPGKMWSVNGDLMEPLLAQPEDGTPYHSTPYQALPKVYVQNSSLEIAWAHVVAEGLGISGRRVAPFFTEGLEGFSIDYPDDVELAERWIANGEAELPYVEAVLV